MRWPLLVIPLVACAPPALTPAPQPDPPDAGGCAAGAPVLLGVVRNARDLGGLAAAGGPTLCGRVLRSAAPGALDAEGCEAVAALGVGTIIDLREEGERLATPSASCLPPVVTAPLPIPYGLSAADYLADLRADASITRALEAIATSDRAVLFHCTYGRDRSGVLAAVLLRLAGVSRDDVLRDYQRTERAGIGTTPQSLEAVLDELDAAGGAEAFLRARGVSAVVLEQVRGRLLR